MSVFPETFLKMSSAGNYSPMDTLNGHPSPKRIPSEHPLDLWKQRNAFGRSQEEASDLLKRHRRQSAPPEPSTRNQTFFFVDRNSSSSEKRSHVMRHHIQEKRRQRKLSNRSSRDWQQNDRVVQYLPWENNPTREIDPVRVSRRGNGGTALNTCVPNSMYHPIARPSSKSISSLQPPPPVTSSEPLPMILSQDEVDLVYHWSRLSYWSGQNPYVKDQIFRTAMRQRSVFQVVILTYVARWKVYLYGDQESSQALRHLSWAIQAVNRNVRDSFGADDDGLAMALVSLAIQEERFGSKDDAEKYISRATSIIRPRTGWNTPVETYLLYVRYIMSPHEAVFNKEDQQWLVTFLRGAEDLMKQHHTETHFSAVPERREAFQMESPLFPLLASGPRPSGVPLERRKYVVERPPTQEVSRSAALIYITAALWEFRDSASRTRRFLNYLTWIVTKHGLDRDPVCETFLWLLLEEGYDEDLKDPERAWSTGALLMKHKLLRPDLQFHFNEMLMNYLMMERPIRGIDVFEKELEMMGSDYRA